jgi:hypothetical protein
MYQSPHHNIEKQFQKNVVPGKSIAIDESTVGFKCKIAFKIYNPPPQKKAKEVGHVVICIS